MSSCPRNIKNIEKGIGIEPVVGKHLKENYEKANELAYNLRKKGIKTKVLIFPNKIILGYPALRVIDNFSTNLKLWFSDQPCPFFLLTIFYF